ncbi:MAG: hypothetical protein ACHBN1_34315 [Heteroscytonema crispum UTEX LB 1556]
MSGVRVVADPPNPPWKGEAKALSGFSSRFIAVGTATLGVLQRFHANWYNNQLPFGFTSRLRECYPPAALVHQLPTTQRENQY